MKDKKLYYLFCFVTICICIFMGSKVFQNDTFYTIKIGEFISKYGVDMVDHFSIHNISYSYPHWLYDYCIFNIYNIWGFNGLYIFNIIVYIFIMLLFYKLCLSFCDNFYLVSLCSLIVCMMISSYVVVRAQSISYILFLLEIFFIRELLKTGKNRYGIYLFFISVLICNIHCAVFPFYFILFLPYIVEGIIYKFNFFKNIKNIEIKKERYLYKLLIFMFVGLLGGFITPIGNTPFIYFILTSIGNSQEYIMEHARVGFDNLIIIITVSVVVISSLVMIFFSKRRIRIIDLFMILGLSIMAIFSQRHFSLFAILGMLSFINILGIFIKDRFLILHELLSMKIFRYIIIVELMIVSIVKFSFNINKDFVDSTKYPVYGVKFIKDNYDIGNIRIFNGYNYGSYMLFNDVYVFIDSRADLYTKEFSGLSYDIFDDYMDIMNNGDIVKLINYDIDMVICYKNELIYYNLINSGLFDVVYEDDYFSILYFVDNVNN